MELPVRFVYAENGKEKSSIDENKRMNEIDQLNKDLHKWYIDHTLAKKKLMHYAILLKIVAVLLHIHLSQIRELKMNVKMKWFS